MKARTVIIGFLIGACIPLFWGIMGLILFNVPEGLGSQIFWSAVYITCPFWVIEGNKALFLMPLLNGIMYALLFASITSLCNRFNRNTRT